MSQYIIEEEFFEETLLNIENKKNDRHEILKFSSFLEKKLKEASLSANEIKFLNKNDNDYSVHEEVLDSVINDFNRIYNIDKKIFENILASSGFSENQIKAFDNVLKNSNDTLSEVANILIDSEIKGINILQNPNSKSIISNKANILSDDNFYSELLDYIIDNFAPSQKMEYLAKMSILQRTGVFENICKDKNFEKILNKIKNKEDISENDKYFINAKIEEGLNSITKTCPVIQSNNDFKSLRFIKIASDHSHKKIAGRGHPDAYGIYGGVLTIATVTSNTNFKTQNNQSMIWANAIENTFTLKENFGHAFSKYKIIVACSPIINENAEKGVYFKKFQKELKKLSDDNILKPNEIDTLKRMSVDAELLSILCNYSKSNYEKVRENIEFYVLGENFIVKPKAYEEQYYESIKNINISTKSILKIIENNPDLFSINTALKNLVGGAVLGIKNAKNNILNCLNEDENKNTNIIINNDSSSMLSKIKTCLIKARNDSYKEIDASLIGGVSDNESLLSSYNDLEEMYKIEKEIVIEVRDKTNQERRYNQLVKYIKSDYQNLDFSDLESSATRSKISQILKGSYGGGVKPTEKTLNGALNSQMTIMNNRFNERKNYHLKSIGALSSGLKLAIDSGLPYNLDNFYKRISKLSNSSNSLIDKIKNLMNEEQMSKFDDNISKVTKIKNLLKP